MTRIARQAGRDGAAEACATHYTNLRQDIKELGAQFASFIQGQVAGTREIAELGATVRQNVKDISELQLTQADFGRTSSDIADVKRDVADIKEQQTATVAAQEAIKTKKWQVLLQVLPIFINIALAVIGLALVGWLVTNQGLLQAIAAHAVIAGGTR